MSERVDFSRGARDMDPDACVAHGGHCWVRSPEVLLSIPPIYTEWCKHCPAYRRGRPQEEMAWDEPIIGRQTRS